MEVMLVSPQRPYLSMVGRLGFGGLCPRCGTTKGSSAQSSAAKRPLIHQSGVPLQEASANLWASSRKQETKKPRHTRTPMNSRSREAQPQNFSDPIPKSNSQSQLSEALPPPGTFQRPGLLPGAAALGQFLHHGLLPRPVLRRPQLRGSRVQSEST